MMDPTGTHPPRAAPELVEAGYAVEVADAPYLHAGLNLADLAHVTVLWEQNTMPDAAGRALVSLLLDVYGLSPAEFPYDPAYGETYNCRERYFSQQLGELAGWMQAGRPRREAVRVALRLRLRRDLVRLVTDTAGIVEALADKAEQHAETIFADQTYLQQAQPSTFGHYLLSFAYPLIRSMERLLENLTWVNQSPAGAGCVNGSRLVPDRERLAQLLGFDQVIEHTRDAMWQTDGLLDIASVTASMATTISSLAEDLEIYSSQEFDFVDLDEAYTRSSVLMPQKHNPYSLSMLRGHAGLLIGKMTELFAVMKTPSARSDNLIFSYGEVPRLLEAGGRAARLMRGVVSTLSVNDQRMMEALVAGFSQATDLAEYVTERGGLDYRSAYYVVGRAVQWAAQEGLSGGQISAQLLDDAARQVTGRPLGFSDEELKTMLDPAAIVDQRTVTGGAAPQVVHGMAARCRGRARGLTEQAAARDRTFDAAENALLERARRSAR